MKFYRCRTCGNIIAFIQSSGIPVICCGEKMGELIPNTVEASTEKHLPAVEKTANGINVMIGSVAHPMEEGHHISFVYTETKHGGQRKNLEVGKEPKVSFGFSDDQPIAVYAYCNLHGLWKTEIN